MRSSYNEEDDVDDLELLLDRGGLITSSESDAGSSITDNESEGSVEVTEEHYNAIRSTVIDIATALGGIEEVTDEHGITEKVYVIGDECLRCLRDLRTLLHQDQDDQNQTIPRIFAEINIVQKSLLPLLLKSIEAGDRGLRIALACTDLLTTLTWPIDIAAEQQAAINKDNETAPLEHIQSLLRTHVSYKAEILRIRLHESQSKKRTVLDTVTLHLLLPAISKPRLNRSDRDTGTISMCLHLFRNLLAIQDPPSTSLSSAEAISLSNLQNELLIEMKRAHILDTILMLASNADSRDFQPWNVVTAECIFHIFHASSPRELVNGGPGGSNPRRFQNSSLKSALASESRQKGNEALLSGTSRHSRYQTAINFKDDDGVLRTARTQRSLRKTREELLLHWKDKQTRKVQRQRVLEEAGAICIRASWSSKSLPVVSTFAEDFLKSGFEVLARSVLRDIRSESFKAGNIAVTRTRLMRLSIFFIEFFMHQHVKEEQGRVAAEDPERHWTFDLVSFWLEPWALKMAWLRAATARDDRAWLEFVTAVQLWSTLLQLADALSKSPDEADHDLAEGLQATHFYDEMALDTAKSITKCYKSQSFRCLEAILDFAHVMPRSLERYAKDKEGKLYVKAKKQVSAAGGAADATTAQEEQEQIKRSVDNQIKERKFELQKFQSHLCSHQLVQACFTYLSRWKEIRERVEERVAGVLSILHRLAVKAGALRLFYPYAHRTQIKRMKGDPAFWGFVAEYAPKTLDDFNKLFDYILNKFDKLSDSEKAAWADGKKPPRMPKPLKPQPELEIRPSHGHRDDVRIAVGLLVEANQLNAITWVKGGLEEALRVKQQVIAEAREVQRREGASDSGDEDDANHIPNAALDRFADFVIPYHEDANLREQASTDAKVKLLCRLLQLHSVDKEDKDWAWIVPAMALPSELERDVALLDEAIRVPFDTEGEDLSSFVCKKRKASNRLERIINEFGDEEQVAVPRGRAARAARKQAWIDDDIIEDSDEEIEIGARLLREAREARGESTTASSANDDVSSPPSHRRRLSSNTSSEGDDRDVSPLKDRTNIIESIRPRPRPRLSKRLFLGSENEDSDSDTQDDGGVADVEAEADDVVDGTAKSALSSNTRVRLHKRKFRLPRGSDDDDARDDSEGGVDTLSPDRLNIAQESHPLDVQIGDDDTDNVGEATHFVSRKRRAIFAFDDEEDSE